jgi:hypothetical protein
MYVVHWSRGNVVLVCLLGNTKASREFGRSKGMGLSSREVGTVFVQGEYTSCRLLAFAGCPGHAAAAHIASPDLDGTNVLQLVLQIVPVPVDFPSQSRMAQTAQVNTSPCPQHYPVRR